MARRKVAPENRIRAAQACENCKRRKQKCNGTFPCNNCSKRLVQCLFFHPVPATGTSPVESNAPPEHRKNSRKRSLDDAQGSPVSAITASSKRLAQVASDPAHHEQNPSLGTRGRVARPENFSRQSPTSRSQNTRDPFPVMSTANGAFPQVENGEGSEETDEAELQGMSRMLNDGKGRMLYIGDSAPLSYLQTIRQLVSSVMGTSALTVDPHRHTILEASVQTPPTYPHTYTLPDREAGLFLVESFFVNTKGMLHLFDERSFKQRVERTYQNPLAAEQSWMCILYLVFAVGLQLRSASPQPSPKDAAILKRLLSDKFDRSELFYLGARHLKDSASGIEDGDFASIQALLLMTLYMLSVGKRNTAWAYIGMAVRLSYALGLHRVETQRVYDESERTSISVPRILLWRSLYVMDRFLSSCLGRPTAIQDEEISEELFPSNEEMRTAPNSVDNFEFEALSASMRAARILGTILHQIYRSRKVSLRIARNVAVSIHEWTQSLPEILQWRPTPIPHDDPGKAMGQLHIWMTYFSTIILLTRPFLLLHVKKVITEQQKSKSQASPEAVTNSSAESRVAENPELNKYSAACVRSATHLIRAVQTIRVKGCLPRRNPFIINWMFIAALIVLTNSLFNIYENHENDSIAQIAVLLHQHFGECDPLAARYLQILNSFLKTISDNRSANMAAAKAYDQHQDPIENLFSGKPNMQHIPEMAQDPIGPNYAAAAATAQIPRWNWAPNLPSGDMLPDITASGLTLNDLGNSVEGLVYPGSEELLGPDLGPIMEEVIHFDTLWPLDEDTGLYHGNIPMYGTSSFL